MCFISIYFNQLSILIFFDFVKRPDLLLDRRYINVIIIIIIIYFINIYLKLLFVCFELVDLISHVCTLIFIWILFLA